MILLLSKWWLFLQVKPQCAWSTGADGEAGVTPHTTPQGNDQATLPRPQSWADFKAPLNRYFMAGYFFWKSKVNWKRVPVTKGSSTFAHSVNAGIYLLSAGNSRLRQKKWFGVVSHTLHFQLSCSQSWTPASPFCSVLWNRNKFALLKSALRAYAAYICRNILSGRAHS